MLKRHVALLTLVAVLLTAASIALSRRDSQDWRANRSRRLFPFPWQDTVAVTLDKPDGTSLRFEKSPRGEWQVGLEDGLFDVMSYGAVDELSALATLAWREPMSGGRPPNPGAATLLTATGVGGQQVRLALGDAANNLRMVVIDDDAGVVYGVNQDLLKFIDWPAPRFRNLSLALAGSGQKPAKVVVSPKGPDETLRVSLEKTASGWRLIEPISWPVDETRLDILLRWLERLRAESIEAEFAGDLEWFGFDDESAFVEVTYQIPGGAAVVRRIEFGKETDAGGVYARVVGRNPVFSVGAEMLAELSLGNAADHPRLWRNFFRRRALNAVGDELPESIVVERLLPTPARLTVRQHREMDSVRWTGTLESGGESRTFAVEPPDSAEPMRPLTALITGLSSLRVKTFLADVAPGPDTIRWTAYPGWRFVCTDADGVQSPALTIYAADADGGLPAGDPFVEGRAGPQGMAPREGFPEKVGIAFSIEKQPAVMEMFGELAYLLCLPPYRYQSRRMVDSDPSHWLRVEVATPAGRTLYTSDPEEVNEQWWLRTGDGSEPLMDDNNIFVGALLELSQLRAEALVADAASLDGDGGGEFGLDQPAITAIVYVSKRKGEGEEILFSLAIGGKADEAGTQRYARVNESGPVFLISARLADALVREYR